jgi:hypothetical protein
MVRRTGRWRYRQAGKEFSPRREVTGLDGGE